MMKTRTLIRSCLLAATALVVPAGMPSAAEAARPPAPTLKPAPNGGRVDQAGFIRHWLVLEPASVNGRLTEEEVEKQLQATQLPASPTALPRAGESVAGNGGERRWHALETTNYNLNLYHFAWALSKPTSNVLFEIATVVEAPQDMQDVRLAIGSNAASVWFVNGERVVALYNDRQAVIDDGVSKRLSLRKGRNVIRAIIINAGGATDFCARFLDAEDRPIRGLTVSINP